MTDHLYHYHSAGFVELLPEARLADERDALDWLALCGEHGTSNLLVHSGNLSPAFFDLRSGVAGAILLKFVTYRMKVAAVLAPEQVGNGRFSEMVRETNRGQDFRVYYDREPAVVWLSGLPARREMDEGLHRGRVYDGD